MENPRTESAREHDDSDIIDNAEPGPSFAGSSGGNMQRDVAAEAELERVRDPEAHEASTSKTTSIMRSAMKQTVPPISNPAEPIQSSSSDTVTSSPAIMPAFLRASAFTGKK